MSAEHVNVVTAPVVSEATGVVDIGYSSLADIIFTERRRCEVVAPQTDNGSMPDNSMTKTITVGKNNDKPIGAKIETRKKRKRTPLRIDSGYVYNDSTYVDDSISMLPLRLRGGNGECSGDLEADNEIMQDITETTPINVRKRRAGDSPPGSIPDCIITENKAIETIIRDCKAFLMDMQTATKLGKKWVQGIEDFLSKIHSCSMNIALEAAVISGKHQEARTEAAVANHRFQECLRKQPKQLYASTVKDKGRSAVDLVEEDVGRVASDAPLPQRRPVKDRIGDFPELDRQTSTNKRGQARATKKKVNQDKLNAAKKRPVKPAFIIEGEGDTVKMDDIWKVVSRKIPNPKLDGCRRTTNGNYVLTSSDKDTTEAIRSISEGLKIREQGPRKPRVKLKGIPNEYTPEFISQTIISQNQSILTECTTEDIRPLFRCGKRNVFSTDWVIEVSPRAYKGLNGMRTYVGMISTFPRPFTIAPYCRKCLLTTHKTADCKEESFTCFHCAKPGHNRADCPNRNDKPYCAHCKGEHATLSKVCVKWAEKVRALQLRTSYD